MNGDGYSLSRRDDRHSTARDFYASERRERDRDRGERDRERVERRHRSRSPHRSSRSSRRDYEDAYSRSSRYDREPEYGRSRHREDEGRDRDRDRDREQRSRRDDKGRAPDRDLARSAAGAGARKRSTTPPSKAKSPTPDLTDIVPITERKRRLTMWDIKPQGYENVTAEQAKMSGMFPLPGAPRQAPMDPSKLQAFMAQPGSVAATTALKASNSRQAKRLIVSNFPTNTDDESILNAINSTLLNLNALSSSSGPEPATSALISQDRTFALVEFRNAADTTLGLAFDGMILVAGRTLSIRRPSDYIVPIFTEDEARPEPGVINDYVPDSLNKILVANLPVFLQEDQVIELMKSFGELKAFILVKDTTTDESKGIAFTEYADPATTLIAVEGLNGMEVGDKILRVSRASIGIKQAAGAEMGVNAMTMMAGTTSVDLEAGPVLQLLNMVTAEELMDGEEYEEICEDIKEECEKYGPVQELKIPRPSGGSKQSPGVGKVFVKFANVDAATAALRALAGRKFADRTVVVTYFSTEMFDVGAW